MENAILVVEKSNHRSHLKHCIVKKNEPTVKLKKKKNFKGSDQLKAKFGINSEGLKSELLFKYKTKGVRLWEEPHDLCQ